MAKSVFHSRMESLPPLYNMEETFCVIPRYPLYAILFLHLESCWRATAFVNFLWTWLWNNNITLRNKSKWSKRYSVIENTVYVSSCFFTYWISVFHVKITLNENNTENIGMVRKKITNFRERKSTRIRIAGDVKVYKDWNLKKCRLHLSLQVADKSWSASMEIVFRLFVRLFLCFDCWSVIFKRKVLADSQELQRHQ